MDCIWYIKKIELNEQTDCEKKILDDNVYEKHTMDCTITAMYRIRGQKACFVSFCPLMNEKSLESSLFYSFFEGFNRQIIFLHVQVNLHQSLVDTMSLC